MMKVNTPSSLEIKGTEKRSDYGDLNGTKSCLNVLKTSVLL